MAENKQLLLNSAMAYGLILGIFWVVKYILFMFGFNSSTLTLFYMMMGPLTLLIAYVVTRKYQWDLGGKIGFFHAWQFGIMLYFFAALIVAIPHFIFYRYIAPPGFLENAYESMLEILENANVSDQIMEYAQNMAIPSPISMAIQDIFNNVFYGILFSLPIAYLCNRKDLPGNKFIEDQE